MRVSDLILRSREAASRRMATEKVSTHTFAISRLVTPEACMNMNLVPPKWREQGMPGARCTRGLVCKKCAKKRTRAYRYSRNTPAFPAQSFYGLCRALPGDEFVLPPSLADWRLIKLGRVDFASAQLGTSNGCRDHTVLPYAQRLSSCAIEFTHGETRPANTSRV
jgi:hypothetical protein